MGDMRKQKAWNDAPSGTNDHIDFMLLAMLVDEAVLHDFLDPLGVHSHLVSCQSLQKSWVWSQQFFPPAKLFSRLTDSRSGSPAPDGKVTGHKCFHQFWLVCKLRVKCLGASLWKREVSRFLTQIVGGGTIR